MKLIPHPAHPPKAKLAITVGILISAIGDDQRVQYVVTGDVDAIRWPETTVPARTNGLWQTTCFELFAGERDSDHYSELNLSPSGQWAAYDFNGYRAAMRDRPVDGDIAINVSRGKGFFVLTAPIDEPLFGRRKGMTVVIEELDGTKSFWALAHPSPEPDFHHSGSFIF